MIDRCGRNIDYLRISVTDRCNLRCIYCMPEEGIRLTGRENILQEPEIIRVCRVMAELGIKKIKNYRWRTAGATSDSGTDPSDKSNSGY